MLIRNSSLSVLMILALAACSASHGSDCDAFVLDASPVDAAVGDASRIDATHAGHDADPAFEAGVDSASTDASTTEDAAVESDASVTCTAAASCGARSCGRNDCGASCGECSAGFYCNGSGTCADRAVTPPPGAECFDAFGTGVVEGSRGFRVCADDPERLQRCICGGGGASAWVACDPCTDVRLEGARGERCATDAQCADPVPCHPTLHLCGERCDRGVPAACPPGTGCGIPGDIAGACLPSCDSCGAGCDDSSTCRRAASGNVCVPSGYGWATGC